MPSFNEFILLFSIISVKKNVYQNSRVRFVHYDRRRSRYPRPRLAATRRKLNKTVAKAPGFGYNKINGPFRFFHIVFSFTIE